LYAAGRYPDSDIHLGYGGNRKTGYQVTDSSPDVPMVKGESKKLFLNFDPKKGQKSPIENEFESMENRPANLGNSSDFRNRCELDTT
jgi:hypothetical protein